MRSEFIGCPTCGAPTNDRRCTNCGTKIIVPGERVLPAHSARRTWRSVAQTMWATTLVDLRASWQLIAGILVVGVVVGFGVVSSCQPRVLDSRSNPASYRPEAATSRSGASILGALAD